MMAPFPTTIEESRHRNMVNKILEDCWDEQNSNINSGYEIQPIDEWIVDNQNQQQIEQEQ